MERPLCLTARFKECRSIDRIQAQPGNRQQVDNGGATILPGTAAAVNSFALIPDAEHVSQHSHAVSAYQPVPRSMPRERATLFDMVPHISRKISRTQPRSAIPGSDALFVALNGTQGVLDE